MSATDLKAMNCTTCGGTLPALAGHKAKAMVCSYCGSVMDRHDGYKVLAQYRDMPRPAGPFRLGMTGDVLGVEQTIVGIVGVETFIEGHVYSWTNYQLYAPTHGYSWMTWNNGHLTHSRKVRDANDHTQSSFFPKSEFGAMGRSFKMFEQYQASIFYIEGELTWVPKIGDTVGVIEGIDPPFGFSMNHTGEELETEMQTYLNRAEILESFGVDADLPKPAGVHAIQPFEPGEIHSSASKAAKMFLPLAAVAGLGMLMFGGGSTVASATLGDPVNGGELSFEAGSTSRLMSIEMKSNLSNAWAWYNMTLVHKESGEEVEFGNGLQYYSGYEGGESWSEGSQTATLRFKPPKTGQYTLRVKEDSKGNKGTHPVYIEVRKNIFVSRYFVILALICALIYGSMWLRSAMFESARWGSNDEDDDDD